MLITTKFDIGDRVRVGDNEGRVVRISIGQDIIYAVTYWHESQPHEYVAYDWELELIESMAEISGHEDL